MFHDKAKRTQQQGNLLAKITLCLLFFIKEAGNSTLALKLVCLCVALLADYLRDQFFTHCLDFLFLESFGVGIWTFFLEWDGCRLGNLIKYCLALDSSWWFLWPSGPLRAWGWLLNVHRDGHYTGLPQKLSFGGQKRKDLKLKLATFICWCDYLSFRSKVITLKEKKKDKKRRRNMRENLITDKE